MNYCTDYTILTLCLIIHTVLSEGHQRQNDRAKAIIPPLPINSKFFDPLLDDESNLELIDGEYADESNGTVIDVEVISNRSEDLKEDEKPSEVNSDPDDNKFIKTKKGEEKFLGTGLLSWIKPLFGGLGSGGGLYGAQYYGLGNHYGVGLGRPNGWNFPFYNYPYFNYVKSSKTEAKNAEKE